MLRPEVQGARSADYHGVSGSKVVSDMGYYRDLALELRRRGLSEPEVRQQLRATMELGGEQPSEVFGGPTEYAARFPVSPHRSVGQWIALLGLITALLLIIATFISGIFGAFGLGWSWLVIAVGVLVVAVLVGYLLDRRLPDADIRVADKEAPGSVGG